jgi:threonine/homoserine/homoserine lactone efflux protein
MNLSAPTQIVFWISLVVAIIGIIAALGALAFIPLAAVWIMVIAYIILAAGCLLKGV